jgi:hypothetical protein
MISGSLARAPGRSTTTALTDDAHGSVLLHAVERAGELGHEGAAHGVHGRAHHGEDGDAVGDVERDPGRHR